MSPAPPAFQIRRRRRGNQRRTASPDGLVRAFRTRRRRSTDAGAETRGGRLRPMAWSGRFKPAEADPPTPARKPAEDGFARWLGPGVPDPPTQIHRRRRQRVRCSGCLRSIPGPGASDPLAPARTVRTCSPDGWPPLFQIRSHPGGLVRSYLLGPAKTGLASLRVRSNSLRSNGFSG
jgi:hypothetical protein